MKNDECTIYIASNGNVHPMTAEQLLSQLLPALAFGHATIKVVPDKGVKEP